MHEPISHILAHKGSDVLSVAPTATVLEAVTVMTSKGVGAVLVKDSERPVGIFTERDILRRVVAERLDPGATEVSAVMTRELAVVKPTISAEDAMAVMTEKRCRHLPVVEGGQVVGLISIGDLTRWAGRHHEVQIKQLVDFITGKYPA